MFKLKYIAPLALTFLLTACGAEENNNGNDNSEQSNNISPSGFYNSDINLFQLSGPIQGDTLVTLHTNHGDITIRMFPEETPVAYENFVTHARNGFYDGVTFHRVIYNFMIQSGDPTGTGAGGESIFGHGFSAEPSEELRHIRGAVAMAHPNDPNNNGSQFYIVHSYNTFPSEHFENYSYTQEMVEAFGRYGGTPHLDLVRNPVGHTVFGQVIAGIDVVDSIAEVELEDPFSNRPIEDVIIESVTVETYGS
ncbi:MAG: peptidylprolyl isomerase [Defluviitaleaceae bacterium]|nr:peptidylprolyl isomerase [Defluviitaleaceae bacterium]